MLDLFCCGSQNTICVTLSRCYQFEADHPLAKTYVCYTGGPLLCEYCYLCKSQRFLETVSCSRNDAGRGIDLLELILSVPNQVEHA